MDISIFIIGFVGCLFYLWQLWMQYETRDYVEMFLKTYRNLRFKNRYYLNIVDNSFLPQQYSCVKCTNDNNYYVASKIIDKESILQMEAATDESDCYNKIFTTKTKNPGVTYCTQD